MHTLRQAGDLTQFQGFADAATRSGQLLNLSDVARNLGIAVNTAKAWFSALEASFQVMIVRPYFANIGKRFVKTPKVHFTNTDTLCFRTGLRDPEHAALGPLGGALLGTAEPSARSSAPTGTASKSPRCISGARRGRRSGLSGRVEGGAPAARSQTVGYPQTCMASGIASLHEDLCDQPRPVYMIHQGEAEWPLGPHASALTFARLWR